ncbi:MAG TPA: FtsX-like permease family protein, partial [Candidatus Limnocylindrales bacterium]
MGLGRLAARRVRSDLPFLVTVWLVLLAATTLVAGAFQYSDAVATSGLRRALLDAAPTARGVAVTTAASPAQAPSFDATVSGILSQQLGPVAPVNLAARSGSLAPVGLSSDQAATQLTLLGGYANLQQHAQLTAGSWPVAGRTPVEASLSEAAAKALGLKIGDQLALLDASVPGASQPLLTVVVTGTWTTNPDDPYWLGDPLDIDGIVDQGSLAYRGPFMVAPEDLLTRGLIKSLSLTWRAGLALNELVPADVPGLEAALPGVAPSITAALPARQPVTVTNNLAPVLAGVQQSLSVAQGGVSLLILQFMVLAAFAVILVAALLAERRRRENRILESRGATRTEIVLVSAAEAILITLPAVILAPPLAALAVHLLASAGPLARAGVDIPVTVSSSAITAAIVTGIVAAAVLIAPSLPIGGRLATLRLAAGREGSHMSAQRFGIDLALLLVAGLALWQLRLYGSPVIDTGGGELGVDPLLVAGPAIGLAACCLLATRLLPRLARVAERIVVNRPNLVTQLGAHDLARRPLRSIRSTLLVMLAAGLTTFALVYDATWVQSQSDQAAYQAATDIRVATPAYSKVPAGFLGPSYRAIPGVTIASPTIRTSVDVGGTLRTADLVGVDADQVPGQLDLRPGTGAELQADIAGLASGRPIVPATPLPGKPVRLQVTVDANLTSRAIDGFGLPNGQVVPQPQGIEIDALVIDGDGAITRFSSTSKVAFSGQAQTLEIPLQAGAAVEPSPAIVNQLAPPIRLEALEISLTPADFVSNTTGSVAITSIAASGDATGGDWATVPFDPGQPGWSWLRTDQSGQTGYAPPPGQANAILVDASQPL